MLNEYNEYVDSLGDREFTRNVYTYTYEGATYESGGFTFDYGVYVGEQNEPVMFGKLHKATSASDIEDFMDNVYYEWDQKAETYENDLLAYGKDIADAEERFGDRERHTSAEYIEMYKKEIDSSVLALKYKLIRFWVTVL